MNFVFIFIISWITINLQASEPLTKELNLKQQAKEMLLDKISPKHTDKSTLHSSYYLSYGYSKRKAPVITVSAAGEVNYEDPTFHRITLLKHMEGWNIGFSVDYDQESSDISSIIGHFGGQDWFVTIESAKLNGEIKIDEGATIKFKDNKYLDIKFLKYMPQEKKKNSRPPVALGIVYYTYERASIINQNKTTYYDPKATVQYLGIVFENDSIKFKLTHNITLPRHSWYFYNTTSFGLGQVKMSSSTILSTEEKSIPEDDTYFGLGMMGEYELGYVYSFLTSSFKGALKIGYNVQLENPYIKFDDVDSSDISPSETFFTHGPQITLIATF